MYLRGVKTHLARTVSAARRLKTCTVIWSWPEISLAEPDNRQTTSCASPPLDSPPPPLIWPVFNYGPSHFDTSGRNTKQECIWEAWTVADPSDNLPSGLPTLRRRRERRKSILNRFVGFFFSSRSLLEATVTKLYTSRLNWVSAAWVVAVSMATAGPTEHNHWGETLSSAVYSPSFSEVMLNW